MSRVDGKSILFFCDTETTGLDPKRHGITQIAGEIGELEGGAYKALYGFNYKVRPFDADVIEDEALRIQGRTREQIAGYDLPHEAHKRLTETLESCIDKFDSKDKAFFIAYNSPFDNSFMREFWLKCGDHYFGSWFWNPDICVMRLAAQKLLPERLRIENFKLGTVARALGIDYDEKALHNAFTDVSITIQMYLKLIR